MRRRPWVYGSAFLRGFAPGLFDLAGKLFQAVLSYQTAQVSRLRHPLVVRLDPERCQLGIVQRGRYDMRPVFRFHRHILDLLFSSASTCKTSWSHQSQQHPRYTEADQRDPYSNKD